MSEKKIQQSFLRKTKRFFTPAGENLGDSLKLIGYFLIEGLFGILFIFFIQDITFSFESQKVDLFYATLLNYAVYFGILFVILTLCHSWWTMTYNRYKKTIEKKYMPKYITFDMNHQEKIGTGKSIAIISKGIKMWAGLIDKLFMEMVNVVLSVGLTIVLLFQINNILVILLIFLLIITLFIGMYLNTFVIVHRKKRIELDNLWSKAMVKIIMAKNEILQSQKILKELENLGSFHELQIIQNKKMSPYMVPFFALGPIIVIALLYIIFLYFGKLYFDNNVSLSVIVGLSGAIIMMQKVFMNLLDFIKNFTKEFSEVQNLWDFFDATPQIIGYEQGEKFVHKNGTIHMQDISYSYDDTNYIFSDFSLTLEGGKVIALVGPSGGGKSTLVKLVSGYIKPEKGEVIVDGQKLSEVSLKSFYSEVGYLTQEPSIFDGTIRENLLYATGGKNISNKKLEQIISLAQCNFIHTLPNGLETEIGERGIKLSGGQRQRLAIAKIFLKDPKIIILDEPTSALDSVSERSIGEALKELFQGRTVIVIAHRLQTVKHADDILVIENGKIIERGTHSSLIRKKGFYKEMLDLQSGF